MWSSPFVAALMISTGLLLDVMTRWMYTRVDGTVGSGAVYGGGDAATA